MIKFLTACIIILFSLQDLKAHEKPWKVNGLFLNSENKPLECHIFCSLSLLSETLNFDFLNNETYNEKQGPILKEAILRNIPKLLLLTQNSQPVPVFLKDLSIDCSLNQEDPLPPGIHRLNDVDVGIVLMFSVTHPLQSLKVDWHLFPDPILDSRKQKNEKVTPADYKVKITMTGEELNTYSLSSSSSSFSWKKGKTNTQNFVKEATLTRVTSSHAKNSYILLISGAFLAFIMWIFIPAQKLKGAILCSFIIAIILSTFFLDLTQKENYTVKALPTGKELDSLLTSSLTSLYSATPSTTPEMLNKRLAKASINSFYDHSFVSLYKAKVNNPEVETIIEDVKLLKNKRISHNTVECEWSIKAYLRHSAHLHTKNLKFRGKFKMLENGSHWKIETASILPILLEAAK